MLMKQKPSLLSTNAIDYSANNFEER